MEHGGTRQNTAEQAGRRRGALSKAQVGSWELSKGTNRKEPSSAGGSGSGPGTQKEPRESKVFRAELSPLASSRLSKCVVLGAETPSIKGGNGRIRILICFIIEGR